eukprot:173851_1
MISLKVIFINCLLVQFNLKNWIICDILWLKNYLKQYWYSLCGAYGSYDVTLPNTTWIKLITTRAILKLFLSHHKILFADICGAYNDEFVAAFKQLQKILFDDICGGYNDDFATALKLIAQILFGDICGAYNDEFVAALNQLKNTVDKQVIKSHNIDVNDCSID